jgi:hypothetical protein
MFNLHVALESVGLAKATDLKEENIYIIGCLEIKMGSSFWCFKGKKTNYWWVFLERGGLWTLVFRERSCVCLCSLIWDEI